MHLHGNMVLLCQPQVWMHFNGLLDDWNATGLGKVSEHCSLNSTEVREEGKEKSKR